jgi:hypothetical protein
MYDGSSGFRSWANVSKVKKEPVSVRNEEKVDVILQAEEKEEDWAKLGAAAAAGDWANAETTAEWGAEP